MNDIRAHSKEYDLIYGNEIYQCGYSFTNSDDKVLRIEPSENIICVEVDDATYKLDRLELNNILKRYKYRKSRVKSDIYATDNYSIDVSVDDDSGIKHILLGADFTIWYESAGEGEYQIIDGTSLMDDIRELAKESEKLKH